MSTESTHGADDGYEQIESRAVVYRQCRHTVDLQQNVENCAKKNNLVFLTSLITVIITGIALGLQYILVHQSDIAAPVSLAHKGK